MLLPGYIRMYPGNNSINSLFMEKQCSECGNTYTGRTDKKFCSESMQDHL